VGVPRIVGLAILNGFGITSLNDLPVNAFAVAAADRERLTQTYSYALATNFRPHDDYRADIRGAVQPMNVLVGRDDEVFRAENFGAVFEGAGRPTRVTIVPGVGHVGLTLQPAGVEAVVSVVKDEPSVAGPR
jgi:pimeloyl-ACP methyl ester carboxylesterase